MNKLNFNLTEDKFRRILHDNRHAGTWFELLRELLPQYEINTVNRAAGFLSQCSHESAGFTTLRENLNYSAGALDRVFPKYFKRAGRNAADYHRKPIEIANVVYAGRMGNGDIESGDGWRYRGRGLIQLTGKNNYTAFAEAAGIDLAEAVFYLQSYKGAAHSACWFWQVNRLNRVADTGDVRKMTRIINGGYNGIKHRKKLYDEICGILNE